jgi:hypothetical protein
MGAEMTDSKTTQRMIQSLVEELKNCKSLYRIKQLKKQIEKLEKERRKKK